MTSKIKNDSSRYLTRAALGGALVGQKVKMRPIETMLQRTDTAQRDAQGVLDQRWYIQLPRKR